MKPASVPIECNNFPILLKARSRVKDNYCSGGQGPARGRAHFCGQETVIHAIFEIQHPASEGALHYHEMTVEESLQALRTSREGLPEEEARARLVRHGRNELAEGRRKTLPAMFLAQFADFMIIVLILAAVTAGIIGEFSDTAAIAVIVILNAVLGFVQEYRAERAMAALKKM